MEKRLAEFLTVKQSDLPLIFVLKPGNELERYAF